ncbi:hypothetical protein DFK95_14405 [Clostridioides difficile]|nr:hypothetical protein [Clostridioides difficile]MCL6884734.1 hypothetical protein [Clostridioides difficile]MCZ1115179.1 hypothetical protein [Clostridioides difficile]MDI6396217.1 hypothetical protein [Clostridioides difficile]
MSKNNIIIERCGIIEKKSKNGCCKIVVLILLLIGFICVLTLGVQTYIQNSIGKLSIPNDANNLNATWIGSLASYWGGILGGIISGLLTFIGVAWTIKYYRDSDVVKGRLEHLPYLEIELKEYTHEKIDGIDTYKINMKSRNEKDTFKGKKLYYRIGVKNIGRGFVNTLAIDTGENAGGMEYSEVIQVNDNSEFCLEVHTIKDVSECEIGFAICYIDCMTNEYAQRYRIEWKNQSPNDIKLYNGYPEFLGQIHSNGKS